MLDSLFTVSFNIFQGDVLFNSWKDIFSGDGAYFLQQPRVYSFSGRNILSDFTWCVSHFHCIYHSNILYTVCLCLSFYIELVTLYAWIKTRLDSSLSRTKIDCTTQFSWTIVSLVQCVLQPLIAVLTARRHHCCLVGYSILHHYAKYRPFN